MAYIIRSNDKYLSRKYFCEYLIGFAQDSLEKIPRYVMIFLLECVPPSTGLSLEGGTGAYLEEMNQFGSPSIRFAHALANVSNGALPDSGAEYMNNMNCMFGEARTNCQ